VYKLEKDMNGWMKGKKENSGEIGMFPAIYVEEITQVFGSCLYNVWNLIPSKIKQSK
jgi:hypothetical protein